MKALKLTSITGSSKVVNEFVSTIASGGPQNTYSNIPSSSNTPSTRFCELRRLALLKNVPLTASRFQRGVYPAEDFTA